MTGLGEVELPAPLVTKAATRHTASAPANR